MTVWRGIEAAVALLLAAGLLGDGALAATHGQGGGSCAGAEPVLESAAAALGQGQWADAEGLLQPLSASRGDCSGVVLGLARLRAAQGASAQAEALFDRAIALAPGAALGHALLAQYWLSRGRYPSADYQSSLALSLDPDCSEALVVQGQILGMRGSPPAAREALERAVSLAPANAEAHYQLGLWFFRGQRHPEAIGQFEKVAALRPMDARAQDYLALSLEALGEAEGADLAYRRALALNEGPFADSFLDYNYGSFLLKSGRLDESRSHLDRAVAGLPDRRGPAYERGKLNLALKDYGAARKDAERALGLRDPGSSVLDLQVYYLLATVYVRLGESELAGKYAELARTTPIPDQVGDRSAPKP